MVLLTSYQRTHGFSDIISERHDSSGFNIKEATALTFRPDAALSRRRTSWKHRPGGLSTNAIAFCQTSAEARSPRGTSADSCFAALNGLFRVGLRAAHAHRHQPQGGGVLASKLGQMTVSSILVCWHTKSANGGEMMATYAGQQAQWPGMHKAPRAKQAASWQRMPAESARSRRVRCAPAALGACAFAATPKRESHMMMRILANDRFSTSTGSVG